MWKISLALVSFFLGGSNKPQDSSFSLTLNVPLVSLDVSVSDQNGRPVGNLTREDFLVYENGEPREIRNFSPVDSPYNILLLVDCNNRMQESWPSMTFAAARLFINSRPQDRFAVATFGTGGRCAHFGNLSMSPNLTFSAAPTSWFTTGQDDVYGALSWSLQKLEGVKSRKGVVVLTNGLVDAAPAGTESIRQRQSRIAAPRSEADIQKVNRTMQQSGARFYFIVVRSDIQPGDSSVIDQSVRLQQLAESSGGHAAFPKQPDDVLLLCEQIGRELGTSFSLGYPFLGSDAGEYRRIVVRTRDVNWRVSQSRDGYFAP